MDPLIPEVLRAQIQTFLGFSNLEYPRTFLQMVPVNQYRLSYPSTYLLVDLRLEFPDLYERTKRLLVRLAHLEEYPRKLFRPKDSPECLNSRLFQ